MQLQGKVAIITGGGSGIGQSTAELFAEQGAKVAIADWNEENGIRTVRSIAGRTADSSNAIFVKTDVSNADDVKRLVEITVDTFGHLDIVFNNAAAILPKFLEDVEEPEWNRLIDINLKSVYLTAKYAIPELRKAKGCIISMASLNGLIGQKQNAVYAATKGGIIAITKALALDYAPDGVRVNCICPAGVMTPLLETWIKQQPDPTAARSTLDDMHPLGRTASSVEIAQAVLFLASNQASFITGVALPVEGGASLGY
ncbi:SDR family NAD(P)-dependent oxidoreductase [Paenibacillus sp. MBLB4367]|uniref:SDR family NAD(P)-dependent oxidoreductase n=1 Tax=Paenibacillus sp. MBLB4367 TaxID=3384767 RepID=UPI0039083187